MLSNICWTFSDEHAEEEREARRKTGKLRSDGTREDSKCSEDGATKKVQGGRENRM